MRLKISLSACALLLAALPVLGQETPKDERRLIDAPVTLEGRSLGRVSDVTLGQSGSVTELIVRTPDGLVVVPYSSVSYDSRDRSYVVASGTTPRAYSTTPKVEERPAPVTDRFAKSGGRLVREEEPTPPARLERPAPRETRDSVSTRWQDMASYARLYGEPTGSVSSTRNIDRLPSSSPVLPNYTTASEMYGWRTPYYRLPPPTR